MSINVISVGETDRRQLIGEQTRLRRTNAVVICVGDEIEGCEDDTLRGHGTQSFDEDKLVATVCGVLDRVNKLVTVRPLHRRYVPEVGDVVVGRVREVVGKRWRIDLQSQQEAHLLLSAVTLPGGVQRRRTAEDELNMRAFFREGDLVSAEVQAVQHDGTIMLHTRSAKYGRLVGGQVVKVPAELVKRQRLHFQQLDVIGNVHIIFGCNGLIWVSHTVAKFQVESDVDGASMGSVGQEPVASDREAVARTAQGLLALAHLGFALNRVCLDQVVRLSMTQNVRPAEMLNADFLRRLATLDWSAAQETM